jgi:ankyrin repeat protein
MKKLQSISPPAPVFKFSQNMYHLPFSLRTPLHFAAEEGHKEICKVLVAAKADVAATCWCSRFAPHHPLSPSPTHSAACRLGQTPLKYAMIFQKSYVVSYLRSIDAPH